MSFNQFILKEQYLKVKGLGDRLELMKLMIDWNRFIPLVRGVFFDNSENGGRPHTDELIVVRSMILQGLYGLSDPELEFQCHDRLSFRNFLGFPEKVPDFTTLWKIRDRLKENGVDKKIWEELQRQLDEKGYEVKKGVIQDATFIEADVGRKRYYSEKKAKKEGKEIIYTEKQKQHIDQDGSFSVKSGQVHYGYKNHIKTDAGHQLVREYEVTTASLHDTQVQLIRLGDPPVYRDKGYFGKPIEIEFIIDKTMDRATKSHELTQKQIKRNRFISKIRSPLERPFSVIKRIFNGARTMVKNINRVSIKEMFKLFGYNLYQLVTLQRKKYKK